MTTATCGAPVNVTQTSLRLTGNIQAIPLGGSVRFRYGTVLNGPYPNTVVAGPYANGGVTADLTGLIAGTAYHFITEVLDAAGAVVAASTDCTASTLSAANGGCQNCNDNCNGRKLSPGPAQAVALLCDLSAGPDCQSPVWSVEIVCDASGKSMYAVLLFCNGAPKAGSAPSYFDFTGTAVTPVLPVGACSGSDWEDEILCDRGSSNHQFIRRFALGNNGDLIPELTGNFELDGITPYTPVGPVGPCTPGDFEQNVFCDGGNNDQPFISRVRFDESGDLIPDQTGTFALDGVTPYTPVGPVKVCGGDVVDIEFQGPLCEKDPSGQIVGQAWHKIVHRGSVQLSDTLAGYRTSNPSAWIEPYTIIAGNTLEACDNIASRDCSPSSDVELTQTNCTGSAVPAGVLAALSPGTVNSDEPVFDNLCTDSAVSQPESYAAPFPVNEPLRSATSGMTLFGNAVLTASAAGGNVDPAGAGWLRLTQDAPGQAGVAIINAAFPSTTAIEFEYSFATYTNTGGEQFCGPDAADGHVLMLLDGNQPIPAAPGASGGALGYSWNNVGGQVGIAAGVLGIGVHEFATYSQSGFVGQGGISAAGVNNAITVRGAGNSGAANSPTYSWLATQLLPSGRTVGRHPRTAPVKVRGSLQPSGAQMILNVTMDFGTGYEPVITNLLINQTMPTNLRIGLGAATGGCWNAHEIRDLVIAPAARRRWRTITPSYAAPPACATLLQATAQMKYTITSDTQAVQGGDNDDEHFVGWAIENPPGTYSWLSQKWIKSAPVDVGVERTLTLNSGSIANLADLPNLRLVVGAETVDLRGSYGVRFSDLSISVVASGCPVQTIKTLPISSPCPLPVVVSGSNGAVSATVNTVDVQIVCSDLGQLFRREINDTSGTPKITFISQNGSVVSPSSWTPGPCADCECQKLAQPGCVTNSAGVTTPVTVVYSFLASGAINTAATQTIDKSGAVVTLASTDVLSLGFCDSGRPCYTCRG